MSTLICGSFAFDTILVFRDRFRDHIFSEQQRVLSVSFLVPEMRREFGGTAGNIAYNLRLLGGDPLPMGVVGSDFTSYAEHMDRLGIPRQYVRQFDDHFTAQAFITTDLEDNQITAFHPGPMEQAHLQRIEDVDEPIEWGIVSPDGKDAMIQHAAQFAEARIPFLFDPGQGLPAFTGDELLHVIDQAKVLAVNDYEWHVVQHKTGHSASDLSRRIDALIVTRGGEGSDIYTRGEQLHIQAARPESVVDPTGCGDAYRAGVLFGLSRDYDWQSIGRIASVMGAYKVEKPGSQNHEFTHEQFKARMEANFGSRGLL